MQAKFSKRIKVGITSFKLYLTLKFDYKLTIVFMNFYI